MWCEFVGLGLLRCGLRVGDVGGGLGHVRGRKQRARRRRGRSRSGGGPLRGCAATWVSVVVVVVVVVVVFVVVVVVAIVVCVVGVVVRVGMGTLVRSLVVASDACLWYVGSVLLVFGLGDAS